MTNLNSTDINSYISGLERFKSQGVSILVDGKDSDRVEWLKMFYISDGSFYMGDFVEQDGILKEIHFNRTKHQAIY